MSSATTVYPWCAMCGARRIDPAPGTFVCPEHADNAREYDRLARISGQGSSGGLFLYTFCAHCGGGLDDYLTRRYVCDFCKQRHRPEPTPPPALDVCDQCWLVRTPTGVCGCS